MLKLGVSVKLRCRNPFYRRGWKLKKGRPRFDDLEGVFGVYITHLSGRWAAANSHDSSLRF
jgi:hypothetical protein